MATTYNPNFRSAGIAAVGGGSRAYGGIPAQTALPNPAGDLAKVDPNLSQSNTAASANILNELNSSLSPNTISNLRDNAANFGVSSGMPGSDFSGYRGLRNLGIASQDMQRAGLQDLVSQTGSLSKTQTVSPETQIALSQSNNQLAAAPDPAAAAAEQNRLFNAYLDKLSAASSGVKRPAASGGGSGIQNMAAFGGGTSIGWY